ncbi:ABC transporter ATP-binding protein [Chryseolinea lacunae]|uniref:ABC transporter ATP-binding protein n=1 Tax=Chryseolinea lacunae TaxID=2801331 RepID=A0ABS1KSV7_9BACT|nr:ABC transporter ATP-binding protein [Chryseolinea lacunae]MBL0742445.1 ABC transporter ATP-binding protein [Chryseolinea lacunae]
MFKKRDEVEEFWALKDISFTVEPGESIGIIGRNGAGKSTLLKILSKITPPTTGRIVSRGRIASLLEVGTGFHQELTGRENIYMNGSILGMRKWEIDKKFDEIVDFSGTDKFLDMALKHYSSGMQLRLAFAVAAHLEPEILVLDEVLAVGDVAFQRKCFQKMEDISSGGRTIILVSHNMTQVKQLCKKGVLLDQGKLQFVGNMHDAISGYLNNSVRNNNIDVSSLGRMGTKSPDFTIQTMRVLNVKEDLQVLEGDKLSLEIEYEVFAPINELVVGFSLTDFYGNNVVECRSTASYKKFEGAVGRYRARVDVFPGVSSGTYNLNVGARSDVSHLEFIPSVASLDILPAVSELEEWNKSSAGILSVKSDWDIKKI